MRGDATATIRAACAGLLALGAGAFAAAADAPADALYLNGYVYTVDAHDRVAEGLAVRGGRILYVGTSSAARALAGPATRTIDLNGRMLMPGLVDGHMHPLEGGTVLMKCNLHYERLTVAQLQARIEACLDATRAGEPDRWLEVGSWFREAMLPSGVAVTRATLDALKTRRPIYVMSSFGHTALVNTRALQLVGIDARTADPMGGRIDHEPSHEPSGILEDNAADLVSTHIPKPTAAENAKAALAALAAMREQGITSFLDADTFPESLAAFAAAEREGALSARAHFALHIAPEEAADPQAAIARVRGLAQRYDRGKAQPTPALAVHNIKLYLDGIITAPALTGAMLEPYFVKGGSEARPVWQPGQNRGPAVYFPPPALAAMLIEGARAHFEPHMHADGDRAVRAALDGIAALRREFPGSAIRAAIAHDEIVSPADFPRFRVLEAIPVLSFQWEKRAPDTVEGELGYLGPERYRYIEPAGFLARAGALIAYGSDWPIDPLNEWFALKVAVTRENDPAAGAAYAGRLGTDPGLTVPQAVRAITANAAYELHAEADVGSLETGKLADFIVLDRNILRVSPEQIADVKVLLTMVGGRAVYEAAAWH